MDSELQKRIHNHCRVQHFLIYSTKHLHKIFKERWETYCKLNRVINPWNNDEASGKELVKICASNIARKMKDALQVGNMEKWDITVTNCAIQSVSEEIRKYGRQTDKNEDKLVNDLREIRNEMAHSPKTELTDDEYTDLCHQLEDILLKFGESQEEIDRFKESLNELGQTNTNTEFTQMKEKANKLFKDEKFMEAIKLYDKILQLSNILPENQAVIFSNRCAAYLKFRDDKSLKMAKRDAEWAIQLWPSWWRGYYRLGCVQAKLREFNDALESLETALVLNRDSKEVLDEISDVKREYGIISREEYLRPVHQPKSSKFDKEEICKTMGITEDKYEKLLKLSMDTSLGDMIKGDRLRDDENYTQAAACYAKAAKAKIPAGMYNLALLHESGKGVKRDFDASLRLLQNAANEKALIMIGSGVPEAQHLLGIKYELGIGVQQNFKTAVEWYEKAVANNFPPSANNLGLLYKHGLGVERSLEKAFEHFKMAAQGGDTPSMNNLAQCYFAAEGTDSTIATKDDITEGMKWLKIADKKGDMVAEKELERRQKFTEHEAKVESIKDFFISTSGLGPEANPLDEKQFRKEVEKAAQKGSFTAKRQLDIWDNLNIAMESFKKNDKVRLFGALSKAIRLDHQIVNVPEIFHPLILESIKANPNELDIITCNIRMNSKNPDLGYYVSKCIEHSLGFDEFLSEIAIAHFIVTKDFDRAIEMTDIALTVCPLSLRFLYVRALALSLHPKATDECIKALDEFLAVAPKDHDKVPACHYRKASYFSLRNRNMEFKASMKAGIEAEKHQLPCFLPYQFPSKDMLMKIYTLGSMPRMFTKIKNIYFNS